MPEFVLLPVTNYPIIINHNNHNNLRSLPLITKKWNADDADYYGLLRENNF